MVEKSLTCQSNLCGGYIQHNLEIHSVGEYPTVASWIMWYSLMVFTIHQCQLVLVVAHIYNNTLLMWYLKCTQSIKNHLNDLPIVCTFI